MFIYYLLLSSIHHNTMPHLYDNEPPSLFIFPSLFQLCYVVDKSIRSYSAGILFACGWWFLLDAHVMSSVDNESPTVGLTEWIPGLLSTTGMMILYWSNQLKWQEGYYMEENHVHNKWVVKGGLFIAVTLLAGGLTGSVSILIFKYVLYYSERIYYGIACVMQNVLVMASAAIIWFAQNTSDDYEHSILS
ncbi:hypothetical protein BDB01DRAFT_784166 [Pilobolus umbonatus]|nr:hypothetical protein BDB01DRAFT_784166 [Pilobolus umbonatus]